MVKLNELCFRLRVTKVRTESLDKLISFIECDLNNNCERLACAIEDEQSDGFGDAINSIATASDLEFSLYALIIIHCYSAVENNRNEILVRFLGADESKLSYIKYINKLLENREIYPDKITNQDIMNEFRLVNNKIKHNRRNAKKSITLDDGTEYKAEELKSLYSNGVDKLNDYLSDLYTKAAHKSGGLK